MESESPIEVEPVQQVLGTVLSTSYRSFKAYYDLHDHCLRRNRVGAENQSNEFSKIEVDVKKVTSGLLTVS